MRIHGLVLCAALTALATAAHAQSGTMSMSGSNNSMSGANIFSRQDMAMMIVDRDKATKGMTDDQKAAARQEEMTKDRAETPDQRMARKTRYDSEWAQITPAEQTNAMTKLDAQMKARLEKTIAFIKSLDAGKFAGAEDREIHLKFPTREMHFSGKDYLNNFVLPNVYFHITTGYDILRMKGVPLGKPDYLSGEKA